MRDAIVGVNPDAARAMAERLRDLIARGLWTPRRNAVHDELARFGGTVRGRPLAAAGGGR